MSQEKTVVVYLDSGDSTAVQINRGLLTEGRRIADILGGDLCAVEIGLGPEVLCTPGAWGAATVYAIVGNGLSECGCDVSAWALATALRDIPFRLLLFADTATGADLAPRVAASLGTAAVLGCSDISVEGEALVYHHPLYGGQLEQKISYHRGSDLEIATIGTEGLYERPDRPAEPRIITIPLDVPADLDRMSSGSPIPPDPETVDIRYAKRIIGIGAGCAEFIPQAEELARLLNASIATTRPVVDDGRIPKSRMIGQTGKTVTPDLYLALGVSGSPHHVAGIQQSKTILSVNKDSRAPVFGFSDRGFEADLTEFLPKLIDRIKRYREDGSHEKS
jgi:electron transfer flavoprotein alpha subunit